MKDHRLRELGSSMARSQDRVRSARASRLAAMREAVLDAADEAPEPRLGRSSWSMAAAALAAAVAIVVWSAWPAAMTFEVGVGETGVAGAWIAAPREGDLPLDFSDGTRVLLDGGSRARVDDLEARGARVVLESGGADVSVVARADAAWRVGAGPFEVHVTGTRFYLNWSPDHEVFVLSLDVGSVEVTGPVLGRRQSLTAGQVLRVSVADGTAVISDQDVVPADDGPKPVPTIAPEPTADGAPDSAAATTPAADDPTTTPRPRPARRSKPRPAADRWQSLASRGDFAASLEAAEAVGLDDLAKRLPGDELLRLGEVARFAGKPDTARDLLHALRDRFAGSPQAATAAYYLGRIAFERDRDYRQAVHWFSTYGGERPRGPLAVNALGRLMESAYRDEDLGTATRAARVYLRRFPKGPHGDLARRLLRD